MLPEYDINDLLTLVVTERANGLSLHTGQPPVVHLKGEAHPVEGPAITPENADAILRRLASTRQVREFREHASLEFTYTFHDSTQFRVQARMRNDQLRLDIFRRDAENGARDGRAPPK